MFVPSMVIILLFLFYKKKKQKNLQIVSLIKLLTPIIRDLISELTGRITKKLGENLPSKGGGHNPEKR
jgi:chromate transport protein ChrA